MNQFLILPTPDLAPSNFHLLGPLYDTLRGRRFAEEDELKHRAREELRRFSKELHATGIESLTQKSEKCVDNEEDFVEI